MDTLNNNWCIKLDAENRDIIIQYLNENFDVDFQGSSNYYGFYNKLPGNWTVKNDNIQEITFEEFKTQILGEGYKSEILGTSKNNPPIFDNNSSKFLSDLAKENTPSYYDNSNGSLYHFANLFKLNAYEFDILKRVVRCRNKGLFREDLEKTKNLIDLYLKEYVEENKH